MAKSQTPDNAAEQPHIEVSPEAQAVITLRAALAALPEGNPARGALETALADALGAQAMAEAEAQRQRERADEESAALLAGANLPQYVVDSMMAAIAQKYDPAPEPEPEAAAPTPESTIPTGKKPVGAVAAERNANVAAALVADDALRLRAEQTIDAFHAADVAHCTVQRQAGTRYASIVAFALNSAGVANVADYRLLATAIRLRLLTAPYNLRPNGEGTASVPWLAAVGPHALNGPKGTDSLRLKFSDRREIAQYADGRFRLALPNTPNVRFIRTDNAAYAAFNGGSASAATAPTQSAPEQPQTQSAPIVPTPPDAIADPTDGRLATTARCRHCKKRNVIPANGAPAATCEQCKQENWYVA